MTEPTMTERTTKAKPEVDTLIIAFEGLIHFQTKERYDHAALVDAEDYSCHDVHKIEVWRDRQLYTTVDLCKGDVVSFDIYPGRLRRDSLYRRHVPELRDFIVYGDIDRKVVRQMPADGVFAYVTLPPGRLTTWATFEDRVELVRKTGSRKKKCFARFVVLDTAITEDVHLRVHRSDLSCLPVLPVPLTPRDLLVVSNTTSHNASGPPYRPHFPAYARLLTTDGQVSPVRILSHKARKCDKDDGTGQFRDDVEY